MSEPRMTVTPVDLYAFGNRSEPRPPRLGRDVVPGENGVLTVDLSSTPEGASLFADPAPSGLTGHYHRLPRGTVLPKGLAVKADGCDAIPDSPLPLTHYTIHVVEPMTGDEFIQAFVRLPWEYGGRQ